MDTGMRSRSEGQVPSITIHPARAANAEAAMAQVEALTASIEVGRIYDGKVISIKEFGAFVEILPGTDGLVHISQLDSERVNKVEDVVSMGDEISVMITGIDDAGKIRLSRQAVLEGWSVEEAQAHDRGGRPSGGGSRPGGSGRRRDDRRSNDRGGDRGGFRRR